jgi:hypothetical protein
MRPCDRAPFARSDRRSRRTLCAGGSHSWGAPPLLRPQRQLRFCSSPRTGPPARRRQRAEHRPPRPFRPEWWRTWWANFEFTRINIEPTLVKTEIEDSRQRALLSNQPRVSDLRQLESHLCVSPIVSASLGLCRRGGRTVPEQARRMSPRRTHQVRGHSRTASEVYEGGGAARNRTLVLPRIPASQPQMSPFDSTACGRHPTSRHVRTCRARLQTFRGLVAQCPRIRRYGHSRIE